MSDGQGGTATATVAVTVEAAAAEDGGDGGGDGGGGGGDPQPVRLEAESMELSGYRVESGSFASNGQLVGVSSTGTAAMTFEGAAGVYDIVVAAFDESDGDSIMSMALNGAPLDTWMLDANPGGGGPTSENLDEHLIQGMTLTAGDVLMVTGQADAFEKARIDYVDLLPAGAGAGDGGGTDPDPVEVSVLADDGAATTEDVPVTIAVLANDGVSSGAVLAGATDGAAGSTTVNADGSITYTPDQDASGTDSFIYTVVEASGAEQSATVSVDVDARADTPQLSVPVGLEASPEGQEVRLALDIAAAVVDIDQSESLTVMVSGLPAGATLSAGTVDASGQWVLVSEDLPGLELVLPPDIAAGFQLNVTAESREPSNGDTAATSRSVPVSIAGDEPAPEPIQEPGLPPGFAKPAMLQPQSAGDLVGIQFENVNPVATGAGYTTFGQVFAEGALRPGDGLVARIGGQVVPVQVDAKTTYGDGSINHAVLTVQAPAMAAGETVNAMLARSGTSNAGDAVAPGDALAMDLDVQVRLDTGGGTVTIDAAEVLGDAIADGSVETWLHGPLAGEFRVVEMVDESLGVVFDIRAHEDGSVRTDVIVSTEFAIRNGEAVVAPETYKTYDIDIVEGGQTRVSHDNVSQYRSTKWHKEVWSTDRDPAFVKIDTDYVVETGAVHGYDVSRGAPAVSDADVQAFLNGLSGPLDNASIEQNMPKAGGRGDIGPNPSWVAQAFVSQDHNASEIMYANADAAGAIPFNHRDSATGEIPLDGAGLPNSGNGWSTEVGHFPNLSAVPYLLSGSQYHLDSLLAQAVEFDDVWDTTQDRADGWGFRTLMDGAYLAPDGHYLKGHLEAAVAANIQFNVVKYVDGGFHDDKGQLEGWFYTHASRDEDRMSPWMHDFKVSAWALAVQRGYQGADEVVDYMANLTTGRFTSGDLGFDPLHGARYRLDVEQADETPITTWRDADDGSVPGYLTGGSGSGDPQGYAAHAKAALASVLSATGSVDAAEAYGVLVNAHQDNNIGTYDTMLNDPTFNLAPQLKDGSYLSDDQTTFDLAGSNGFNGSNAHQLHHGRGGDDVMLGHGGIDILLGGDGDDTVDGGSGDDFVFGNAGNDVLRGGAGSDAVRGHGGADRLHGDDGDDTLYFDAADTVIDGGAGIDTLALQRWREASIDLSDPGIAGIEVIDLGNQTNDALRMRDSVAFSAGDVDRVSDIDELTILGDAGDRVVAADFDQRVGTLSVDGVALVTFADGNGLLVHVETGLLMNDQLV